MTQTVPTTQTAKKETPEALAAADIAASPLVQNFGIGVRQLRRARGWSQEQLAENSNLNRSYIGEIERGTAIASLVTVEKLATALTLTPSALITRGESIHQQNLVRGLELMAIAC